MISRLWLPALLSLGIARGSLGQFTAAEYAQRRTALLAQIPQLRPLRQRVARQLPGRQGEEDLQAAVQKELKRAFGEAIERVPVVAVPDPPAV